MKRRYVNDKTADFQEVPKRDARKAAIAWGEDCDNLINLLEFCIRNGIKTYACCKGHVDNNDMPYIYFEDQGDISTYLMEKMSTARTLDGIGIQINYTTQKVSFIMHAIDNKDDIRDEFFKDILECLKRYIRESRKVDLSKIVGCKTLNGRYVEKSKEESPFRKVLNWMERTRCGGEIEYDSYSYSFTLDGCTTFSIDEVDEFIEDRDSIPEEEKKLSLMDEIKKISRELTIGINEISDISRNIKNSSRNMQNVNQLHSANIERDR